MNGYYARIIVILKNCGFIFDRQGKGSHEMWIKGHVSVTVSKNCDSRHTANGIMKQAGIDHKF